MRSELRALLFSLASSTRVLAMHYVNSDITYIRSLNVCKESLIWRLMRVCVYRWVCANVEVSRPYANQPHTVSFSLSPFTLQASVHKTVPEKTVFVFWIFDPLGLLISSWFVPQSRRSQSELHFNKFFLKSELASLSYGQNTELLSSCQSWATCFSLYP